MATCWSLLEKSGVLFYFHFIQNVADLGQLYYKKDPLYRPKSKKIRLKIVKFLLEKKSLLLRCYSKEPAKFSIPCWRAPSTIGSYCQDDMRPCV
jgi:hypothetical protein